MQVGAEAESLVVRMKTGAVRRFPIARTDRIAANGNADWSGAALALCMARGVTITWIGADGQPSGDCCPRVERPAVADDVDFHALIVQLLGGTITAVRQFLAGYLGLEPSALLGEDHRLGIGQADVGRGRPRRTEPLPEYWEHFRQPVEAPHLRSVAGEAWEPVGPIVAGMGMDRPDFALLVQDARQVEGNHLLVGEAQVGGGAKRWA
jgi:hypothetical protein